MELSEFEKGFMLLRGAYGDRVFPKERETPLWKRYGRVPNGAFKAAVDTIVLRMPQPTAIIEWLDDRLGTEEPPPLAGHSNNCPPCGDLGFGLVGETIVPCSCPNGRSINPADLARHQAAYNRGRKLFRSPFDRDQPAPSGARVFAELPYDPTKREGA